jgi:hypothetical protein
MHVFRNDAINKYLFLAVTCRRREREIASLLRERKREITHDARTDTHTQTDKQCLTW